MLKELQQAACVNMETKPRLLIKIFKIGHCYLILTTDFTKFETSNKKKLQKCPVNMSVNKNYCNA